MRRVREARCASAATRDTSRSPSSQCATSPRNGPRPTGAHSSGTNVAEIQCRHWANRSAWVTSSVRRTSAMATSTSQVRRLMTTCERMYVTRTIPDGLLGGRYQSGRGPWWRRTRSGQGRLQGDLRDAASARLTGQFFFASSANLANAAASRPGTRPVLTSAIFVIVGTPSTSRSVTVASVCTDSGGVPACGQRVRQRHREARRVGRGDQLLGIGARDRPRTGT